MTGRYWTTSWNPLKVKGGGYHCTKCSPGCEHCWAESLNLRFGNHNPYDNSRVEFVLDEKVLQQPLHWRKPRVVFVCDLCDLFHEQVTFEDLDYLYGVFALCGRQAFLVLTKRSDRIAAYHNDDSPDRGLMLNKTWMRKRLMLGAKELKKETCIEWPMRNVWHGLTICNQEELDEKASDFLHIPGHKWLSIEPMLGPIEIRGWNIEFLDGVIGGGESGPGARPVHPDWVRSVRDQCAEVGVPFFFKQWGRKRKDRLLDGREHNELPWKLRMIKD